jgi:hypothetical protein
LLLVRRFFWNWWWRRKIPTKRRLLQEPHGGTSQKTPFLVLLPCENIGLPYVDAYSPIGMQSMSFLTIRVYCFIVSIAKFMPYPNPTSRATFVCPFSLEYQRTRDLAKNHLPLGELPWISN